MSRRLIALALFASLLFFSGIASFCAASDPTLTTQKAERVLDELLAISVHRIPKSMLSKAEGIAIVPNVIKVGFIAGLRRGHGIVMVRDAEGEWGLPQFVDLTGGSVGFQAGVQGTDVVLIFRTRSSVDNLLKGKFTIGADAAAAAGPVGRNAAAATDAQLKAEILSYSRSRGLFAGVSLDGTALEINQGENALFYGAPSTEAPRRIPEVAANLQAHLNELCGITSSFAPAIESRPGLSTGSERRLDALQSALTQDAMELHAKLTPEWREYLAIPAPIRSISPADPRAYALAYQRYARVNANPEYKELTTSQEFQTALALLKEYSELLEGNAKKLDLPAPPRE